MTESYRNMQEKTVGEQTYQIYTLPPMKALKLKVRLVKIFMPALGSLIPSGELKDLFNKDLKIDEAIGVLASALDEDQVTSTVKEFLDYVKKDGKPLTIEIEFAGNTTHMMKVFWAALEVNYADFFVVLQDLKGLLLQATSPAKQA